MKSQITSLRSWGQSTNHIFATIFDICNTHFHHCFLEIPSLGICLAQELQPVTSGAFPKQQPQLISTRNAVISKWGCSPSYWIEDNLSAFWSGDKHSPSSSLYTTIYALHYKLFVVHHHHSSLIITLGNAWLESHHSSLKPSPNLSLNCCSAICNYLLGMLSDLSQDPFRLVRSQLVN